MNLHSKSLVPVTTLAACIVLSACVTAPPDTALSDARVAVQMAQSDPAVARFEGVDLAAAQKHLAVAEDAAQHQQQALVDHESYLAIRVARLSQVRADEAVAQERIAAADAARSRVQLEARTLDAARAKQAAAAASAEADAANQQSAAATATVHELQAQLAGLSVQQSPQGAMILLTDDYFAAGQAQLQPDSDHIIDSVAQFLLAHPERRVRVEGHTDHTGSAASNLELSLHRAEAVRMALIARGVDPGRSEAVGYGPDNPVAANTTSDQLVRGVEILLSDSRGEIASR
jgi:outer membrane protein OmpA-like peptidoglycan-associated protein